MSVIHASQRRSLGYRLERLYPLIVGAGVLVGAFTALPALNILLKAHQTSLSAAYVAVGGLAGVLAGFLATFYGSIQAIMDTRLRRIAKTAFLRRFLAQVKEATYAGFILAVASVPFMILAPSGNGSTIGRIVVSLWMACAGYSLATFFRVGPKLFQIFERAPPDDDGAG